MALTRDVVNILTDQGIPGLSGVTSAEKDIGDNTVAQGIVLYVDIASWLSDIPTDPRRFEISIRPRHTTGGNDFSDDPPSIWMQTPTGGATGYRFKTRLRSLPRFFTVRVYNNTSDYAQSVDVWIEVLKLT